MKKKILQTISKYNMLERGMHIVVGLSGGPDSVCLFDVLRELAPAMDMQLYAVHVNHKLRPGAAEDDQHYVEQLCREAGVPCYVFERDCNAVAAAENLTSEEAGRKVRYEAFGEIAAKIHDGSLVLPRGAKDVAEGRPEAVVAKAIPKNKIAVALAHNANDQCETILFRLMRGTGTDGLAGIAYKRYDENGFAIIRPILDCMRSEIESYCDEQNLSPRIDRTNSENLYARNRIRNMLIPYLRENFNENIIDVINRLGKTAAGDKDFIREEAEKAYEHCVLRASERVVLDCKLLQSLHKAIRFRVYTIAMSHLGQIQSLTFAQGEAIDALLDSDSPSASCDLSDGFFAAREYEKLAFAKKTTGEIAPRWNIREMSSAEYKVYAAKGIFHGAFSGVPAQSLEIRMRRDGDKIDIGTGSKKLQDFFVDEKLPKHCRDSVSVLARGSEILWIMPSELYERRSMKEKGRFSAKYKVAAESSEPIIVLEKL